MLDNNESIQIRLQEAGSSNGAVPEPNGQGMTTTTITSSSSMTTPTRNVSARTNLRLEWSLSSGLVSFGPSWSVATLIRGSWIQATNVLAASHVSTVVIQKLSILLIVGEFLVRTLQKYLEENIFHGPPTLDIQVFWIAPIFTSIASFSFFLSRMIQLQPADHVAALIGVVSLAMVDCLEPLALTGCMALFWFDVFPAETALLVLFGVWVAAAVSSRCIRCVLYPALGDG